MQNNLQVEKVKFVLNHIANPDQKNKLKFKDRNNLKL